MSQPKQLWLLAGGNGSGKSTFYNKVLAPQRIPFVNADLIAKQLHPQDSESFSYQAAAIAEKQRMAYLAQGRSFCFETVFSHPSKLDFAARARAQGYQVILVFIHLSSSSLNIGRVRQRVEEGGHAVPEDKIAQRIPRTLDYVKKALPVCSQVKILDNSSAVEPFKPVAWLRDGQLTLQQSSLEPWAQELLADYLHLPSTVWQP